MSSIGKLMKQAARIQRQMEDVQNQLAARTVETTSGGGAVKVSAKCDGTLGSIKIDPQAVNPADVQLLEDMILTAVNSALVQAKEISTAEMGKVTWPKISPWFKPETQVWGATYVVLIVVAFLTLYVFGVDMVLQAIANWAFYGN